MYKRPRSRLSRFRFARRLKHVKFRHTTASPIRIVACYTSTTYFFSCPQSPRMARSDYDSESQYYSSDTEVDDDSEDDYVEAGKRKRQPKATIERKTKVKAPPKLG